MRKSAVTSTFITLSAFSLLAFGSQAEGSSLAPDGVAISTHRADGGIGLAEEARDAIKRIRFTMPDAGYVSLNIYNEQGQVVRQLLAAEPFAKGKHVATWDGLDNPYRVPSGPKTIPLISSSPTPAGFTLVP